MGCRSHAHQDVYTEKLTSRVRVLEDQLNAADYEIQVLQQKLARRERELTDLQSRPSRPETEPIRPFGARDSSPKQQTTPPSTNNEAPRTNNNGLQPPSLDPLDIDVGTPSDLENNIPDISNDQPNLEPPPSLPLPPSNNDLIPPPIELGDPQPPLLEGSGPQVPPGQIKTPESARRLALPEPRVASTITLHPGLSGQHHQDNDDAVDGVYAVLTVDDQFGQPMQFAGPLSFVILDPQREGDDARLGRWDIDEADVRGALRERPLRSIQLPLLWQGKRPAGNSVAVFVRLTMADGSRLETDLMLDLTETVAQNWQPQGLGTGIEAKPRSATLPSGLEKADIWK